MTTSSRFARTRRLLVPALLLVSLAGCAEFRAPTSWLDGVGRVPRATAKNPASRIVAIWQPADGRNLNGLPGRGFAGQILFFPARGDAPVAVDGDVRIYVFDDQGDPEEQMKPIHQFDFVNGGWEAQLVEGSLGPAYQVFLPYTRKGTHRAKCSLRIRLQPEVGPAVYSEVIDVVLPGPDSQRLPDPIVSTPVKTERKPTTSIVLARAERSTEQSTKPDSPTAQPGSPAANSSEARIDRIESMLQQLLESKAPRRDARVEPIPVQAPVDTAIAPVSASEPSDAHPLSTLTDEIEPPGRPVVRRTVAATSERPRAERQRYRLKPAKEAAPVRRTLTSHRAGIPTARPTVGVRDTSIPSDPQPAPPAWTNPVGGDVWQTID